MTDEHAHLLRARELLSKPVSRFDHATPGTKVVGLVAELTTGEGDYGEFPIVTVDTGDALVSISCARSVLKNEIRGRDVRIGDALGVEFLGEQHTGSGQKYFGYRVVWVPGDRLDPEPPRIRTREPELDNYSDEPF